MGVNLLQNADFGGGTHPHVEWGHEMTATQIPDGWEFWWRGKTPEEAADSNAVSYWHLPEARVLMAEEPSKPPPPLYNLFTSHSTHCWALWQKVASIPGWPVYFSVNAWPWSSNGDVWPQDDGSGSYWVRVGIDPLGGNDPHAASIVWSHGTAEQVDNPQSGPQWVKGNEQASLFIEADGQGGDATVFIMGYHEWPMKHGTCLLWDAEAWHDEDEPPEPPSDFDARLRRVENIVNRLGHVSGFDRDFAVWLPWFLPKGEQAERVYLDLPYKMRIEHYPTAEETEQAIKAAGEEVT